MNVTLIMIVQSIAKKRYVAEATVDLHGSNVGFHGTLIPLYDVKNIATANTIKTTNTVVGILKCAVLMNVIQTKPMDAK